MNKIDKIKSIINQHVSRSVFEPDISLITQQGIQKLAKELEKEFSAKNNKERKVL